MTVASTDRIFGRGERSGHVTAPVATPRFNRDGDPIGYLYWADLCRDRDYRTVTSDYVTIDGHRLVVATTWTGISAEPDRPVGIFVTRIVGFEPAPGDSWSGRYDAIHDAAAGHARVVGELRAGRWPT